VTQYPVFVPHGEEHLAAIVTVPEGEPRGLVVLVPGGGGAPRTHRFAVWTRAARALAHRGIATVRMDWQGVGDSTGTAAFSFADLPVEQLLTVLRFAQQATGAEQLGIAGNCLGARSAMEVVKRHDGFDSAVLMLLKALAGTKRRKGGVAGRAKAMVRRVPWLFRPARKLFWRAKGRKGGKGDPIMARIEEVARRMDLLIMESLEGRKTGRLPTTVARLQKEGTGHRLELRDLPGGSTRAFQSLTRQDYVIESLVDWFDRTLPPAGSAEPQRAGTRAGGTP